jgi:hypothetical protein
MTTDHTITSVYADTARAVARRQPEYAHHCEAIASGLDDRQLAVVMTPGNSFTPQPAPRRGGCADERTLDSAAPDEWCQWLPYEPWAATRWERHIVARPTWRDLYSGRPARRAWDGSSVPCPPPQWVIAGLDDDALDLYLRTPSAADAPADYGARKIIDAATLGRRVTPEAVAAQWASVIAIAAEQVDLRGIPLTPAQQWDLHRASPRCLLRGGRSAEDLAPEVWGAEIVHLHAALSASASSYPDNGPPGDPGEAHLTELRAALGRDATDAERASFSARFRQEWAACVRARNYQRYGCAVAP